LPTSCLLCLDVATVLGWAAARDCGKASYGSKRMGRQGCEPGESYLALDIWLEGMVTEHRPTTVIFEAPILGAPGKLSVSQKLMGLVAIVELVCARHRIPVFQAQGASVTKALTGKGGRWEGATPKERSAAKKRATIEACRRYGFSPSDDNAADAIGILLYAEGRLTPNLARKAPQLPAGPLFIEDAA
jgi:Holliday junction resolvasome RuvABC endonuclease subunit